MPPPPHAHRPNLADPRHARPQSTTSICASCCATRYREIHEQMPEPMLHRRLRIAKVWPVSTSKNLGGKRQSLRACARLFMCAVVRLPTLEAPHEQFAGSMLGLDAPGAAANAPGFKSRCVARRFWNCQHVRVNGLRGPCWRQGSGGDLSLENRSPTGSPEPLQCGGQWFVDARRTIR